MSINTNITADGFTVSCDESISFVLFGTQLDPNRTTPPEFHGDRHCCDFVDCDHDVLINHADFERCIDVMMMNNCQDDELLTCCSKHLNHVNMSGQKALLGIKDIDIFGRHVRATFINAMYQEGELT